MRLTKERLAELRAFAAKARANKERYKGLPSYAAMYDMAPTSFSVAGEEAEALIAAIETLTVGMEIILKPIPEDYPLDMAVKASRIIAGQSLVQVYGDRKP